MQLEFLEVDYTELRAFAYLFGVFSIIIFGRYLVLSGVYHRWIYKPISRKLPQRILSVYQALGPQQRMEIYYSLLGSIIFGFVSVFMIMAWQEGWTRIYTDWSDYPFWYLPLSFFGAMFIHETYYYWLHRWLHLPKIYRYVHKVHHNSISTSVWTSFSFHPLESLLQAIIIPLIVMIIPIHIVVLLVLLVLMTISAIINHAGIEVYPVGTNRHWLGKWIIGASHHDQHHRKFTLNFGLYFTIWDKWMNTESEDFKSYFDEHT